MKTNFKFWIWISVAVALTLFITCKKDVPNPDEPPGGGGIETVMQDATIRGIVRDIEGNPLNGVRVTTGVLSTMSNDNGMFSFDQAGTVNRRAVIKFEKSGYFTLTRSGVKEDEMLIEAVLYSKGNSNISLQTSFNAGEAKTLSVAGMKVALPASSVVKADGTGYSGSVNADMLYLDPNNSNFSAMMPGGDLAGIRTDNSNAQLISYGMAEISLTDNAGNILQLKEGARSEFTFPIPEGMESSPPPIIPLWYFDEERGIWMEEGEATLQGNVYVGEVSHFSWHNLDYPEERVTIKGKVTDCNNLPLKGIRVTVDQVSDITDSNGNYSVFVPANTPVSVKVLSRDYFDYTPEVSHSISGQPGESIVTQNVSLPCTPSVRGRVINSCGDLAAAYIWIEYTQGGVTYETTRQWVDVSGTFDIRIPSNVTGEATLHAEALDGAHASVPLILEGNDLLNITVELCMDISESALTITPQGGSPVVVPIIWDDVIVIATDNSLSMIRGSEFILSVPDYSIGNTSYDNVSIVLVAPTISFASENVHVDILSHTENNIRLSVGGTGDCFDMTTGAQTIGTIGGILDAPVTTTSAGFKYNVTDWAEVGLPSSFPALPIPIDLVAYMTSPMRVTSMYYKTATQSSFDNMNNILTGAFGSGMEVVDEGTVSFIYFSEEYMTTVQYAPNGMLIEGTTYQLLVGVLY